MVGLAAPESRSSVCAARIHERAKPLLRSFLPAPPCRFGASSQVDARLCQIFNACRPYPSLQELHCPRPARSRPALH